MSRQRIRCAFALVLWTTAAGLGSGEDVEAERTRVRESSGPYCGVYTLYSAAKLLGHEVDLTDLLKPEYIQSKKGSSLGELAQAAHDIGLEATIVRNMSLRELQSSNLPMILHVSDSETPTEYDHFILCISSGGRLGWAFDPPNPPEEVPLVSLLPQWDRYALVVSNEPIDLTALFASSRRFTLGLISIVLIGVALLRWLSKSLPVGSSTARKKIVFRTVCQATAIAILATGAGVIYHFSAEAGLLANASLTRSIALAHASTFLPKLSAAQARELSEQTGVVFVDARFTFDFVAGHIEGAVNIPVSITDKELEHVLAGLAPDARYVVYCQSAGCKYADRICRRLMNSGYQNLTIFRGGWQEWCDMRLE